MAHWSRAHCSGVASSGEAVNSVTGGPVVVGSQAAKEFESDCEQYFPKSLLPFAKRKCLKLTPKTTKNPKFFVFQSLYAFFAKVLTDFVF